jgi:predicted XRE-type DNA-binding protein
MWCLDLISQGFTQTEIADRIGCNQSSINRCKQQFAETKCFDRRSGSGRPKITTKFDDIKITRAVENDRFITTKEIMQAVPSLACSAKTVQRRIHSLLKINKRRALRKPWISEKNRKARLAWAKLYQDWTPEDLGRVLWSDE